MTRDGSGARGCGAELPPKVCRLVKSPVKKKVFRSTADDNALNIHATLNLKPKRQPMHSTQQKKNQNPMLPAMPPTQILRSVVLKEVRVSSKPERTIGL